MKARIRAALAAFWFPRYAVTFAVAVLLAWAVINGTSPSGVTVTGLEEAEGSAFGDTNMLDLASDVKHRRACPTLAQRYAWRWEDKDGNRVAADFAGWKRPHAIPLGFTVAPFLGPDGPFLLSLQSGQVPDPINGGWKERTVSVETCPWMPEFLSAFFSPRLTRGPDVDITFDGKRH